MPAFDTIHNELRLRVPNKPYEFYNDAIRWAVNHICVKTSMWEIISTIITEPDKQVYDLDLPTNTVIHSILYIVRKVDGGTDMVIKRPANGILLNSQTSSDYLQGFKTASKDEVMLAPIPKNGGVTLEVHVAIKPTKNATSVDNDKFFDEYKDTLIYGALSRLNEIEKDYESLAYNMVEFKNGVDSIHVDKLKDNADTPMTISASW